MSKTAPVLPVRWIVQTNLINEKETERLEEATNRPEEGIFFCPITVIPFDTKLPRLEPFNGISTVYGSCNFINRVLEQKDRGANYNWYNVKIFANYEDYNFQMLEWLTQWDKYCLNSDSMYTTLNQLMALLNHKKFFKHDELLKSDEWFIRPNADDKLFSGEVVSVEQLKDWVTNLQMEKMEDTLNAPIFISTPKNIDTEWRLIISEGEVVSSSQYRVLGKKKVKGWIDTPSSVIKFGERIAAIWQPNPIFVLDICQTYDGELKVLECGGINSVGFYGMKVIDIVNKVNEFLRKSLDKE